jgi:hypothetical protein
MDMRRMAGLLFAGALAAVSLSAGTAGAAQAATTAAAAIKPLPPAIGTNYEIFSPYLAPSPECVDVPGATRTLYAPLQAFHCHGYASDGANQLWGFDFWDNGPISVINKLNGECIAPEVRFGPVGPGTAVEQGPCDNYSFWQIVPSAFDANGFELEDFGFPGLCMAASDQSGGDHTPLVLRACHNSWYPGNDEFLETWYLG